MKKIGVALLAILIILTPISKADCEVVSAAVIFANAAHAQLLVKYYGEGDIRTYTYENNNSAVLAMRDFQNDPAVEIVQPNYIYQTAAFPADPLLEMQTYLPMIQAYDAWEINQNAASVIVAVIDSGIEIDHLDLRDNIWVNPNERINGIDDDNNGFIDDINGWDFLTDSNDVRPKFSNSTPENSIGIQHGTGVAGLIASTGNNGRGIAGVAWSTQLMSLRVLNQFGSGNTQTVTEALKYAIDMNVDVINLSLVGTDYDPLVEHMLTEAYEKGVIVVAAAGNVGVDLNIKSYETYPVCYNNMGSATVIGVGAISDDFSRPSFSNYGNNCVDIVAPGVKPYTTRVTRSNFNSQDQYAALFSGTSFAAPQVTGVIALIKQMVPDIKAEDVLFLLQQGSSRINNNYDSGFDYALNAAGSLVLANEFKFLDTSVPIDVKEPDIVLPKPEFLVYPIDDNQGTAYRYQLPGPVAILPAVFYEDSLKRGMRFSVENASSFIISAFESESKQIWRFNPFTNGLEDLFAIADDDEQTVGNVAVGNVDFDPQDEIVVASGPDSKPMVTIYTKTGAVKYRILPYDETINKGLDILLSDRNGDGLMEIFTVPEKQTAGLVKVFEYTGLQLLEWTSFSDVYVGGCSLSVADVNDDGVQEIIVTPSSGIPNVKIFNPFGSLLSEFTADARASGARTLVYDIDQNGSFEYVVTYLDGLDSVMHIYNQNGDYLKEFGIFDTAYKGGLGIIIL